MYREHHVSKAVDNINHKLMPLWSPPCVIERFTSPVKVRLVNPKNELLRTLGLRALSSVGLRFTFAEGKPTGMEAYRTDIIHVPIRAGCSLALSIEGGGCAGTHTHQNCQPYSALLVAEIAVRYVPPKGLQSPAVTARTADLRVQAGRPVRYLTRHYNINTHHPKYPSLPLKENFGVFAPGGGWLWRSHGKSKRKKVQMTSRVTEKVRSRGQALEECRPRTDEYLSLRL
ncbi:hypothetical protein J6590_098160 [Homalodisca vitripennis]|nr:hypothetical protein J6590_098160 [Homalodisca vitripennis]